MIIGNVIQIMVNKGFSIHICLTMKSVRIE
jgi:hypothetical protein